VSKRLVFLFPAGFADLFVEKLNLHFNRPHKLPDEPLTAPLAVSKPY
jgi:hypothetical protein